MSTSTNSLSSEEFDKLVVSLCPKLYADRYADKMGTCMCWGFEVEPGWHDIVLKLSLALEMLINTLPEAKQKAYKAVQVKEKWGTLRVYLSGETDKMLELIEGAEELSAKTCEKCGADGKLMSWGGWCKTLCSVCGFAAGFSLVPERNNDE